VVSCYVVETSSLSKDMLGREPSTGLSGGGHAERPAHHSPPTQRTVVSLAWLP